MPLVGSEMKSKFHSTIYNGLKREFGDSAQKGKDYQGTADQFWEKLANALADIAVDIVTEIQSNAMVMPGQQVVTAGSPAAQQGATVTPGQIQ